jgi:hypothetical protein
VQHSFTLLDSFAERHGISISGAIYFAMIGALNIHRDEIGLIQFRQLKPLQISRQIGVDSKKIARWCSTLAERGLLTRKRGAYAVENVSEWYLVARAFMAHQQAGAAAMISAQFEKHRPVNHSDGRSEPAKSSPDSDSIT